MKHCNENCMELLVASQKLGRPLRRTKSCVGVGIPGLIYLIPLTD